MAQYGHQDCQDNHQMSQDGRKDGQDGHQCDYSGRSGHQARQISPLVNDTVGPLINVSVTVSLLVNI